MFSLLDCVHCHSSGTQWYSACWIVCCITAVSCTDVKVWWLPKINNLLICVVLWMFSHTHTHTQTFWYHYIACSGLHFTWLEQTSVASSYICNVPQSWNTHSVSVRTHRPHISHANITFPMLYKVTWTCSFWSLMSHRACCHTCYTIQLMHYSRFKTHSVQHLKPIKC